MEKGRRDEFKGYVFDREFLEELVLEWIRRMMFYTEFRLSNSIIQSMAIQFKMILHMHWFFPTEEWLAKFRSTYSLNDVSTRGLDTGYKEGKSIQLRDIVREQLQGIKTTPQPKVENEPIEPATETPAIEIIEIDDDIKEEHDVIELDDDVCIIDDLTLEDELLEAHELPFIDEKAKANELPNADKLSRTDVAPIAENPLYEFGDIEDELPRSVCTKLGRTIVAPTKLDIEDFLPTSVCKSKIQQNESPNTKVLKQFQRISKLYDDYNIMMIAPKAETAMNQKKFYSKKRPLKTLPVDEPINCQRDASSPVPVVSKSAATVIPKKLVKASFSAVQSPVPVVSKIATTVIPNELVKASFSDASSPVPVVSKRATTVIPKKREQASFSDASRPAPDVSKSARTVMPTKRERASVSDASIPVPDVPKFTIIEKIKKPKTARTYVLKKPYGSIPVPDVSKFIVIENAKKWARTPVSDASRPVPVVSESIRTYTRISKKRTRASFSGAPSPAPDVPEFTITEIPKSQGQRKRGKAVIKRSSLVPILPKPAKPPMSQAETQNLDEPLCANVQNLIGIAPAPTTLRVSPVTTALLNCDTNLANTAPTTPPRNTRQPPPTAAKKTTRFSQRGPLKTCDEALKYIKLIEEFAMMKENYRLIGFIERLDKLIRAGKRKC